MAAKITLAGGLNLTPGCQQINGTSKVGFPYMRADYVGLKP
jgi:hypothetical protein